MSSASLRSRLVAALQRRRTSLKRSKPSAIPIPVGILVVNRVSVLLGRLITWSSHCMAGGARRDEDDARQAPVLPRTCRPWCSTGFWPSWRDVSGRRRSSGRSGTWGTISGSQPTKLALAVFLRS
ncbi:hypothetical protein B0H10DRAFT_1948055 [Mycena sp. CBHHK59/15]|nr:hypothetical protein B0H10DRAFT_1948055 [Mycena sp. CBHHK59/15]